MACNLADMSSICVAQTRRGCIQELMGCEAKNEFKIYPSLDAAKAKGPEMWYSLEESSCCIRFCCKNNRPFKQTIWEGTKEAHSNVFLEMERPFAWPLTNCCCCNFPPFMQTMKVGDVGTLEIPCFLCIP